MSIRVVQMCQCRVYKGCPNVSVMSIRVVQMCQCRVYKGCPNVSVSCLLGLCKSLPEILFKVPGGHICKLYNCMQQSSFQKLTVPQLLLLLKALQFRGSFCLLNEFFPFGPVSGAVIIIFNIIKCVN